VRISEHPCDTCDTCDTLTSGTIKNSIEPVCAFSEKVSSELNASVVTFSLMNTGSYVSKTLSKPCLTSRKICSSASHSVVLSANSTL